MGLPDVDPIVDELLADKVALLRAFDSQPVTRMILQRTVGSRDYDAAMRADAPVAKFVEVFARFAEDWRGGVEATLRGNSHVSLRRGRAYLDVAPRRVLDGPPIGSRQRVKGN